MPTLAASQCGMIFTVDGAGGFESTSTALRHVVEESGAPLGVEAVWWSHGYGRVVADQVDCGHARTEGQRLAARVIALRQLRPDAAIYLVGHSAGTAVVLAAAEALPPASVDRIVLLSPSVSACYDVRPALRTARTGVEVFYSARDVAYLGVGTALLGTADSRRLCPAAGRVGFRCYGDTPEDATLYARLHQHAWHPCIEWTGNHGGHYGAYQREHLRAFILPLLRCPCLPAPPT